MTNLSFMDENFSDCGPTFEAENKKMIVFLIFRSVAYLTTENSVPHTLVRSYRRIVFYTVQKPERVLTHKRFEIFFHKLFENLKFELTW